MSSYKLICWPDRRFSGCHRNRSGCQRSGLASSYATAGLVEGPPSFQTSVLYWLEKRFHKGVGMGSECSVLVYCIVDNLMNLGDMEISMQCMIGNIPRRVCRGTD